MSTVADLKSFHYLESGEISFSTLDTIKTKKTLDKGCYKLVYLDYPVNRVQMTIDRDIESSKIHDFPEKHLLDSLFKKFFDKKIHKKMSNMGFSHKTGVLMHGKEGTGKTTIMKHYYTEAVNNHNAIVFFVNEIGFKLSRCWDFIVNIRQIQKNPIIIVFDEIDQQLPDNEGSLKTMLDGNLSIDNSITFASTNYLDRIPTALKDRPSRFKYTVEIGGIESEKYVAVLIGNLIGDLFTKKEILVFASTLKGATIDKIKQFCIDKVMNLKPKKDNKKKIGFN